MLQTTIDPSSLRFISEESPAEIRLTVSLAGLSWKKGEPLPATWGTNHNMARTALYPWYWDTPSHLRVFWIIKQSNRYETHSYIDLDTREIDLSAFKGDTDILRAHYEKILNEKIFSLLPSPAINAQELTFDFKPEKQQEIELDDTEPQPNTETKFYNCSMAEFAQKISPLNQALNFIFFGSTDAGNSIQAPEDCIGFAVFPFSKTPGSTWEPAGPAPLPADNMPVSCSCNIPGGENDIAWFNVKYKMKEGDGMMVYCPLTPLPEKDTAQGPIQLRDANGDFNGYVSLQINDIEDQLPALLSVSGKFFDLPGFFISFLDKYREEYRYSSSVNDPLLYKKWISQLGDFITATSRDALGFGYRKESDELSIATRIVRKYCDTKYGEVHSLSTEKQVEYWKAYESIIKMLNEKIETVWHADSTFNLAAWRKLLQTDLLDKEKEIEKQEEEAEKKNHAIERKPLKLNPEYAQLLQDLTTIYDENSLPAANVEQYINTKINEWLSRWGKFIENIQTDQLLVGRILFEQWYSRNNDLKSIGLDLDDVLKAPPGSIDRIIKYAVWFEDLFSTILEQREAQKEAIAVIYKDSVLNSLKQSPNSSITLISEDWLSAIKKYSNERLDSSKNTFFPLLNSDPFENSPHADFPNWGKFLSYLDEKADDISEAVRIEIERPSVKPPDLQIRVDKIDNSESLFAEDLNDELAGHVVLMHRAQTIFEKDFLNNDWRYLNRVRVSSVEIEAGIAISKPLINPYVIPAFLPEAEGNKIAHLQLSNEKLSLVAGHKDSFDDSTHGNEDIQLDHFEYGFDPTHKAYGLWYGYKYEFAGVVMLNSGVLPEILRKSEDQWNIPKENPDLSTHTHRVIHQHLRRVPISKIRMDVRRPDNRPLADLPKELLPLAFELPEWKGNHDRADVGGGMPTQEQSHYLLAKSENYNQGNIVFTIKKPTTSFWNWYAWLGADGEIKTKVPFLDTLSNFLGEAGNIVDRDGYQINSAGIRILDDSGNPIREGVKMKSLAHLAMENDLQTRKELSKGSSGPENNLNDPAVENVAYVVIDRLFPQKNIAFKKYPVQLKKASSVSVANDYLTDFASQIPVTIIETGETNVKLDAGGFINSIEVLAGDIIRICVHSLFESGKLSKFHSWMDEVITDKKQKIIVPIDGVPTECYMTKPIEIWIEAARVLETHIEKIHLEEKLLWNALLTDNDHEKVTVGLRKNIENYPVFAYLSRVEVKHQVWNWNGRLDESRELLNNFFMEMNELASIAKNEDWPLEGRKKAIDELKILSPELLGKLTIDNINTTAADAALKKAFAKASLDPSDGNLTTTPAMEWEAWAFSDRPDFSALVQQTNLIAFRPGESEKETVQALFSDKRPGEEKALYYRFSLIAHSRYELLGEPFDQLRESKIRLDTADNIWRRHLRKCTRIQKLPRPSIRFVIPLTKSIMECNDGDYIASASLLIVLEDRWFSEAGLAEQFEMGIEILESPVKSGSEYLSAGNDPILTGTNLGAYAEPSEPTGAYPYIHKEPGKNSVAVFEAKGPVGLTFDFVAQTPRLKGCAFVIDIPDLKKFIPGTSGKQVNKLQPWSMVQIAVRRVLRPNMCKTKEEVTSLRSEWSAKEWVQFLPSIDSFIPKGWRRKVALDGSVELKSFNDGRVISIISQNEKIDSLPVFDSLLEERMQRFLVVTEKVFDIGGQPCEKFVEVYWYNADKNQFELDPKKPAPDTRKIPFADISEGYLRLLLIRNKEGDPYEPVWDRLFGKNASKKPDFSTVTDDPTAALPIVSERIPYKRV